jgi:lysophospholipase L1-like esterase
MSHANSRYFPSVVILLAWNVVAHAAAPASAPTSAASPDPVRLRLPETIYAVPGVETNVYFDNVVLVLNPANYAFDVTCEKGLQQAERWTFTPSDKEVGTWPFSLEVRDETNRIIASAKSVLKVSPPDAGEAKPVSVLLIGDSLTHASVYPQQLLDLCAKPHNPKLTLVGTHVPRKESPENRHEGYGGWTARRFAKLYVKPAPARDTPGRNSPFLYEDASGKPKLDFASYCRDANAGNPPDFVVIFLGCNDTFGATDETIESTIDDMFTHMDALIAMIRAVSDRTDIGLLPPVPPAATQDSFGANYRSGQTRWQYKRNQHRVVERMLERYAPRAGDRIWIVPGWPNLDCLHNYPQTVAPWNAQTESAGSRINNSVHPAAEGYRQIGDSIYVWLKARLAGK